MSQPRRYVFWDSRRTHTPTHLRPFWSIAVWMCGRCTWGCVALRRKGILRREQNKMAVDTGLLLFEQKHLLSVALLSPHGSSFMCNTLTVKRQFYFTQGASCIFKDLSGNCKIHDVSHNHKSIYVGHLLLLLWLTITRLTAMLQPWSNNVQGCSRQQ